MILDARPGGAVYDDHDDTGLTFNAQATVTGRPGNIPFYEVDPANADQATLTVNVEDFTEGVLSPLLVFYSAWGATDFVVTDAVDGTQLLDELSGPGTNIWPTAIVGTSGKITLGPFNTSGPVPGAQAAWLPWVGVFDLD